LPVNASIRPDAQEATGFDGVSELLTAPQGFRERLHGAMRRRHDALFDLTDAILAAVPSPVHPSLAPACRRGWVSLYAALADGQIVGGDAWEVLALDPSADDRYGVCSSTFRPGVRAPS
jgi:hypothetical protein